MLASWRITAFIADDASVLDGATLELGSVSHGDVGTDDGWLPVTHVDHAIVLNVASGPTSDPVFRVVPPEDGPEPNGGLGRPP